LQWAVRQFRQQSLVWLARLSCLASRSLPASLAPAHTLAAAPRTGDLCSKQALKNFESIGEETNTTTTGLLDSTTANKPRRY